MPADELWPVVTSPVTGHPDHPSTGEADARLAADREAACEAPAGAPTPVGAGVDDIDVDELVDVIRRPLVDPPPLQDKALEELLGEQ